MPLPRRRSQSGQVMVLVAVALLALIGSAALVLVAGSVEWQKNQLQELADTAALDSALLIGVGCDTGKASAIITEADRFVATRRNRTGALIVANGTCATPSTGTDTFAGGLSETVHYPYRAHQQQVEVVLTLTLPISFGGEVGSANTTVIRRAVAQALPESVHAVSATTLTCNSGQVNVGGSVLVQNPIVRNGTCALYAHARFDATSGTYSDLGNVSVYTDGQTWTAPGTCAAGANSGSSSAICSDGYERSGHTAPACATVATSFLSAGDKTVNPDPCAALTGPQPVAPVSTALPPEPNLDPNAIATLLPAGSVCTPVPGVAYPNIVVSGSTVGTGLLPSAQVVKDPSGFYHFKPSCYGYLDLGALPATGISNVQIGPESAATSTTVTATLAASQAGTLLVADIRTDSSNKAFTAPPGWVLAASVDQPSSSRVDIWYYPNNPGLITSAAFGISPVAVEGVAQLTEWRNALAVFPLDQTGTTAINASQTTASVSTAGATAVANELVITDDGSLIKAGQTFTPAAGWNGLVNDATNAFSAEYRLDLPAAVASETVTSSVATKWSLAIATFKPAPAVAAAGAVLDAGFYYFNGSGFPGGGGGGVCLNGGTLLARDVTLEFVGQAGFSSGTCVAGGGASCVGACQFGSDPANPPADAPNALTWLAAPCTVVPNPPNASCPGSIWCPPVAVIPALDRSCTNLLIWEAPGSPGQIAITGAVAKAWLLGSIYWPGTCTYQVNGTGSIAGSLACGSLTMSAGAGAATAVGNDAGISTALVEAVLVE